jgi:two-component system chemotaxis response regulator CheB
MARPLRIVIATASPLARARIARRLAQASELEVLGIAADLSETWRITEENEPDMVILEADLVLVPEFVTMKSLFYAVRALWLVMSEPGRADRTWGPTLGPLPDAAEIVEAHAQVSRLRGSSARGASVLPPARPAAEFAGGVSPATAQAPPSIPRVTSVGPVAPTRPNQGLTQSAGAQRLVLIGASTGGVDALVEVIAQFPADCPPTAIVQHTGRGFSESLVRLLARRTRARVVAAAHGLLLTPGTVAVAAGVQEHLRLLPGPHPRCAMTAGDPVSGHLPSVDVLFTSALPMAERVVAAILTGMGRDGADGLLALRQAGAQTFGQDAASSVVYGMPRVAHEIGAVGRQLPLARMGEELLAAALRTSTPDLNEAPPSARLPPRFQDRTGPT